MLAALIAGERDPEVLAEMAKGRMRPKKAALEEALSCRFDAHHAELLSLLLRQVDQLSADIEALSARVDGLIAAMPGALAPVDPDTAEIGRADAPLGVIGRLDEVTGIGRVAAQAIVAEVGLDMGQFPTPGHLVSWARLTPRTLQSGPKSRGAKTGKGNRYLKRVLGEAAAGAIGTDTFLGARHRRLVKRTGKLKALVATQPVLLLRFGDQAARPCRRLPGVGHSPGGPRRRRVGDRVRFLAEVGRSEDDETFAFVKRPRRAEVLA